MQIPVSPWEFRHYRFGLAGEGQADFIQELLSHRRGVVLDIGCGPQGHHVANLAAHSAFLIAADRDIRMVQSAIADFMSRPNAAYLVADAGSLPLKSGSVDYVVSLGMFAYIEDPGPVFAELRRVTRRDGFVIVSNSVARPKPPLVKAAAAAGLRLVHDAEGKCPAASGPIKRRYLCVFKPVDALQGSKPDNHPPSKTEGGAPRTKRSG